MRLHLVEIWLFNQLGSCQRSNEIGFLMRLLFTLTGSLRLSSQRVKTKQRELICEEEI